MSFTFNWVGPSIPQYETKNNMRQSIADAANFGAAARGFNREQYDKEYSEMLGKYAGGDPRIAEIKEQIAELEAANAELMKRREALVASAV